MEQRIINLQIANEYIMGAGGSVGAVGSHDDVLLEMDFRPSAVWAGTTRRAIFANALGENRTPIILTTNLLEEGQTEIYLVPVPQEAKEVAGECFLTIEGFVRDGGGKEIVRCVTEEAKFRVLPSKLYTNDTDPITPSQAEQLQAEIDKIKDDILEVDANAAAMSASRSEAWAIGQCRGEEVPEDDPAYHNNAKYWSQLSMAEEPKRQENENVRISNENVRITNEEGRVTAETARDTAEKARDEAEKQRAAAYPSVIQTVTDAAASAQAAKAALEQSIVENPGSTVIDPTLSVAGAAAEAAAVGQLKSDLDDILRIETEDIQPVMTNDNYFFNTSGTTILSDDTTIFKKSYANEMSDNWLITVEPGEAYYITSFGSAPGAYAFVSEIKTTYANVIARYHVNEQCLNEHVTVPQGAKYLVVNNFDVGNGMVKKVLSEDPIVYESRIKPIEDKLKSCIVQYKEVSEPYSSSNESLYVYVPSRVGYVRLVFCHSISESENANSWRFYQLSSVADDMETLRYKVTQLGEMEMALRLKDADDFVGGIAHGDEVGDNILVFVDGVKCELSELLNKTEFNELRIITTSTLYSPFDHTTEIATHGKEFVITKDDVVLNQSVNWLTSQTLVTSYMTMLCAIRGNDTVSTLQITDTYYDDGNFERFDISTGGFETYPNKYKADLKEFTLFSAKSGAFLNIELVEMPKIDGGGSFVYNGENTYNKLYCAICGGFANSKPYTTTVGERWKTKTRFKFIISKGTDID